MSSTFQRAGQMGIDRIPTTTSAGGSNSNAGPSLSSIPNPQSPSRGSKMVEAGKRNLASDSAAPANTRGGGDDDSYAIDSYQIDPLSYGGIGVGQGGGGDYAGSGAGGNDDNDIDNDNASSSNAPKRKKPGRRNMPWSLPGSAQESSNSQAQSYKNHDFDLTVTAADADEDSPRGIDMENANKAKGISASAKAETAAAIRKKELEQQVARLEQELLNKTEKVNAIQIQSKSSGSSFMMQSSSVDSLSPRFNATVSGNVTSDKCRDGDIDRDKSSASTTAAGASSNDANAASLQVRRFEF